MMHKQVIDVFTSEKFIECNPQRSASKSLFIIISFIILLALSLRLYAATDNFWLDEIFTYFLATEHVRSVNDILWGIKIEHQFLVTLYMYVLGDQQYWFWYRLPSVILGTGCLVFMGLLGYRRMGTATLIGMLALAAVSYPLIVYSSEARGYAPATFFALAMFYTIEKYWQKNNQFWLLGYWIAAVIAFLYHPASVCVHLSFGLWSFIRELRAKRGFPSICKELALCHGVPFAVIAALYLVVMRHWGSIGGDVLLLDRVIADTMAVLVGLPMRPEFRLVALCFGSLVMTICLAVLARVVRSDIWFFYFTVLLLAPFIMLVINPRPYIYVRYFVILFPFFYLMLGQAMDAVAKMNGKAKILIYGLYFLMIAGNVLSTSDFLRIGRGGYLDAIQYMADKTPRANVLVGSDHDFRNGLPFVFYSKYIQNRGMIYLKSDAWPPEGPDWLLAHNTCSVDGTPKSTIEVKGNVYQLARSYPVLGLSGVNLHVYYNSSYNNSPD